MTHPLSAEQCSDPGYEMRNGKLTCKGCGRTAEEILKPEVSSSNLETAREEAARQPDEVFERLLAEYGSATSAWTTGSANRAYVKEKLEAVLAHFYLSRGPVETASPRVCPDSDDGNHVLKQDGPFSVVYCDACGMNRGFRETGHEAEMVECPSCHGAGSGRLPNGDVLDCSRCNGYGGVPRGEVKTSTGLKATAIENECSHVFNHEGVCGYCGALTRRDQS
jgi:hypothetical protein